MQTKNERNAHRPKRDARLRCVILTAALGLAQTAGAQMATVLKGQLMAPSSTTPVVNATVTWSVQGSSATPSPANTATTDAGGVFAFEIPLAATTDVQISVNANLYNPFQINNIQLSPGGQTALSISSPFLVPKASSEFGAVAGTVQNTRGLPIPNATVSILGAGDLFTATTDSNGNYQLANVGFNSNLTLQASTANTPCIVPTQVPLAVNTTSVTANIQAQAVLSLTVGCPPPHPVTGAAISETLPALSVDKSVQWQQADGKSIASTGVAGAWNAGRVNDILRFAPGQGFLVAADEGGVWSIAEDSTRTATPLSNKWSSVTISSLAPGTGGAQDVYASTYAYGDSKGGTLWETDTSTATPLTNWLPLHTPCGSINKILVVPSTDVIVLACDTGLWWSQIPPPPSVKGPYKWLKAQPAAIGSQPFSGLAQGPGSSASGLTSIVASAWGAPSASSIYIGMWSGGQLNLGPTPVPGPPSLSRTSVASCASNPQIMYAVASDANGQALAGIWQSTSGGLNWIPVALPTNPGLQGDSNQAVAVSPDCSTVAVGWQTGTFVSFNGGGSWTLLTDIGEYNNLHVDIHALTFDPATPGVLFIGSGGGVASTAGLFNGTPTFESDWNQNLFNLEFYDGGGGGLQGVVGGASQDNGVLATSLPNAWQHVNDCGGALECWGAQALFVYGNPYYEGDLPDLFVDFDYLPPMSSNAGSVFDGSGGVPFNAETILQINPPCGPCSTYALDVAAAVRYAAAITSTSDGFDDGCGVTNSAGQCMFAGAEIYVYGQGDGVYGLFASLGGLAPGDPGHWELLNSGPALWNGVTAIAPTYDGTTIFVGNGLGQIYRVDPYATAPCAGFEAGWCATLTSVTVPADCASSCPVTGLYAFNQNQAYATYGHHFMVWNGVQWMESDSGLPNQRNFLALTASDPTRVYIASSAGVFDTSDGGNTWSSASTGLPAMIPGATGFGPPSFAGSHDYLQLVSRGKTSIGGDLETHLYLASYGRSLWHTFHALPAPPATATFSHIKIEIWTGNDDARADSEIDAVLSFPDGNFKGLCLKPSSTTENSPGACINGSGVEWANGADVAQVFALSPEVLDGALLGITLVNHPPSQGADNWDIQGIQVSATDKNGNVLLPLLTITSELPYVSGVNNCIARLKENPNISTVNYYLSANDPLNYNITHPFTNFGATPPGSCPQ